MKRFLLTAIVPVSFALFGCSTMPNAPAVVSSITHSDGVYRIWIPGDSTADMAVANRRLLVAAAQITRRDGRSHFVVLAARHMPVRNLVERPSHLQMTYIRGQQIPLTIPAVTRHESGGSEMMFRVVYSGKPMAKNTIAVEGL